MSRQPFKRNRRYLKGSADNLLLTMITNKFNSIGIKEPHESNLSSILVSLKKTLLINGYLRANPWLLLALSVKRLLPLINTSSIQVSGRTVLVPKTLTTTKQLAIALEWLFKAANDRDEQLIVTRLIAEVLDTLSNKGEATNYKLTTYKQAIGNKAFIRFRW